jgi:hypothetical protein
MQRYVYHMVPSDMVGQELMPLNRLGAMYPHLYERYTKKYFDHPERTKLLSREIPPLNCLWNDVVHFLPIHPKHIYKKLTELGIETKESLMFYQIPIQKLTANQNAMYLYSKEHYKGPAGAIAAKDIKPLSIDDYRELEQLPSATIDYFQTEKEKGKNFGLFAYIPHLLSLGNVNVDEAEIITWNHFNPN